MKKKTQIKTSILLSVLFLTFANGEISADNPKESFTPILRDCIDDDFGDCCEEPFDVWFDYDGDGLGNPDYQALACLEYEWWVTNPDDPNDNCFSNIIDCNGACDGTWVEDQFGNCCEELIDMWQDLDGDGWGNYNVSIETCFEVEGYVFNWMDKNDTVFCESNLFDACGICDGNNSSCTGCTDQEALNYEPENIFDDGSCIYASEHIWHVSILGSDESGVGTVENPFATVNYTIDVAESSDTILVHSGTYYENIDFNGNNVLLTSLFTFTNDTNYIHQTVLDGSSNGSVVTFSNDEDSTAVLAGFSITNGTGTPGNTGGTHGAGIRIYEASPTIQWNYIFGNSATCGAGLYIGHFAFPKIDNIRCYENEGFQEVGLAIHWDASPVVSNSFIYNNFASDDVAGIGIAIRCHPLLQNIVVRDNVAAVRGGGVFIWEHSHPLIKDVKIINNTSGVNSSGLICDDHCDPRLENVIISGNSVTGNGGEGAGVYIYNNSHPVIVNCTITDNTSNSPGGGVLLKNSSDAVIINSIIWNNTPDAIHFVDYNELHIGYSDVEGGYENISNLDAGYVDWIEGNIDADPLFADPENEDFALLNNSPCVDAGTNYFILGYEEILDLGYSDYQGYLPDMGAVESEVGQFLPGDVNDDEAVDVADLVLIIEFILENITFTELQFWLADLNGDGIIDILDIILFINLIVYGGMR